MIRARRPVRLALALALTSTPALADDLDDARAHFTEGVRRFEAGDVEGARLLFSKSEHEHHAAVTLYNLARAEERLGHPQAAVDSYERYLAEAGPDAQFAQAAAVAVAQLRARSARVRVESQPPGARAFVDGTPLGEPTPTTVLLPLGPHHVVVEGEGWRGASDIDTSAGGEQKVAIARPESAVAPQPPITPEPKAQPAPVVHEEGPDGLVFGATFILVPYAFLGALNQGPNHDTVGGVDVGLTAEIGYAFAPRAEILLRGLGALGSECTSPVGSHFLSAGPAIAYRLASPVWIGASLLGGNAQTCRGPATYSTDLVFSPSLDLAVAVSTHDYGQWVITASAAYYFSNPSNDNRLLYFPVGFGVRFF